MDIAKLTELKTDRTKLKAKVTTAAKRLKGAIDRQYDRKCIEEFMIDLEKCLTDFDICHEEYSSAVNSDETFDDHAVVNGLNLEQYAEQVEETYKGAKDKYKTFVKQEASNEECKVVQGILRSLQCQSDRLNKACLALETMLNSGATNNEIMCVRDEIVSFIELLVKEVGDLSKLPKTREVCDFEAKMDVDITRADELKRIATVHLIGSNTVGTQATQIVPQSQPSVASSVLSSAEATYVDASTINVTPGLANVTLSSQSIQNPYPWSSGSAITSSTTVSALPTSVSYADNMQVPHSNFQNLSISGDTSPYVSTVYGTPSFTGLGTSSAPGIPSHPLYYASYPTGVSASYSPDYGNVSVASPPVTTLGTSSAPGIPSHPLYYASYPTGVSASYSPDYGNVSVASPPVNTKNGLHLKKASLPVFSGLRKDWPEFKAMWKVMAEAAFSNPSTLAYELKRNVKGSAVDIIKNVYVTRPEAYTIMWSKLSEFYDDPSACVQSALDQLQKLKLLQEGDFKGLVQLVDTVEATFVQLEQLQQLDTLSMRDVDRISSLLPNSVRMVWIRAYRDFSVQEKLKPMSQFMKFLTREKAAVIRLTESQKTGAKGSTHSGDVKKSEMVRGKAGQSSMKCVFPSHRNDRCKHSTEECRDFLKLSLDKRYETLKEVHACFNCFGLHRHDRCPSKLNCQHCGRLGHHSLLCRKGHKVQSQSKVTQKPRDNGESCEKDGAAASYISNKNSGLGLYAIQQAYVTNSGKYANIFCDSGSNVSYITHSAANKLKATPLENCTLDMTTMGNVQTTYKTKQYEVSLRTRSGKIVSVTAFGMRQITGPVTKLDTGVIGKLFPRYDSGLLQRKSIHVDMLLGMDYFGLFPKTEVDRSGENLSIMEGELGICLQGSHPELEEFTELDVNFVKTLHETNFKSDTHHSVSRVSHNEFTQPCVHNSKSTESVVTLLSKVDDASISRFIQSEELATETHPRCGGCKCSKCPSVGHTYSFREEQELNMIRDGLKYDAEQQCWYSSYPWLCDPAELQDNYGSALATLKSTERTLLKDPNWAKKYACQIEDMVSRGVARKLTPDERKTWNGPTYYISHLAVLNPKSNSTPVRIVFNSSQLCNGKSLNSVLAKGPDSYLNNLLGLLLRWREDLVAVIGDIRKMFNSVHLNSVEQHTHRFLWRDLDCDRKPDIYIMVRVNMGDRPAPAICTEAMYATADLFKDDCPRAAEFIKGSSYVDDLVDSFSSQETALSVTGDAEEILKKGGFQVKCWHFSGEVYPRTGKAFDNVESSQVTLLKGTDEVSRVLGVGWKPVQDVLVFEVKLNFSCKKKGVRSEPNLTAKDVPRCIPQVLTRRMVLEQVMMIFDPLGILCPFTLLAKIYLRETWAMKLEWDDMIPGQLRHKWLFFFTTMFELEKLQFDRALTPPDAVGSPWLIIFGDGSDVAYGFAAYIRWQLQSGEFWCRLIMAKCRIAPVNKISTPQMELNAAVLSKRGRKVIETEMRFQFERVLHIVDSETVLCMINKVSTRFKVYEGVRIGEIQTATDGDMSSWVWMPGRCNTADWLTRGRTPKDLGPDSDWWTGPSVLYQPFSEWKLKSGLLRSESLPGEKKLASTHAVEDKRPGLLGIIDTTRFGSADKLVRVIARIIGVLRMKSFRGGGDLNFSPDTVKDAEQLLLLEIQQTLSTDLQQNKFRNLNPTQRNGLWVVGTRLQSFNPMTPDSEPQVLLPSNHHVTLLLMKEAHSSGGHRGRDGTLARFRQRFWTTHGSKLAWKVKNHCQLCKLRDIKLLDQQMGILPESRSRPSPPFNHVMLDLFGPYKVRGEVQKRISGKVYGVLFTDMVMRAIHIEVVSGYDTHSFLLAFQRFTSIRGWPSVVYSDPGSQLVGAERELSEAWSKIDRSVLVSRGSDKGLKWIFGPADSPWHQGAVESLVKSVKRCIDFSIHNQRLSFSEFTTLCYDVANTMNERPIGTLPGSDAEVSMLTPNSLLLGRSLGKNPGGWDVPDSNVKHRYQFVQSLSQLFWKRWIELGAPGLTIQKKWHTATRNLKPGDVVVVADKNTLRGEYRIALVQEVYPGKDGKVRKVKLAYKNFKCGEKVYKYSGCPDTSVLRSVQRLALLVPVGD